MLDEGRYSVAFPKRAWYPACRSSDLKVAPLGITLMDAPVALFRDGHGVARALADRCPHRNVPLSLGRVAPDGCVQCCYHGWRFDGEGHCRAVPGLLEGKDAPSPTRDVTAYATTEQDGFVWIWPAPDATPSGAPFPLPPLAGKGAGEVVFPCDIEASLHATVENSLDVPHTAFLHGGLFRNGTPNRIQAVRRELPGGVEVQYLGEPIGFGPVRRRAGSTTTFEHWDRFFLPSIVQIEYRIKDWLRITNTIVHLPLSPLRTRAWFVVRYWSPLPPAVAGPIVLARGRQILKQDARILAAQTANLRRFGGERYTSTELDLLGSAVWRLLRQAERAERDGELEPAGVDEPLAASVMFEV